MKEATGMKQNNNLKVIGLTGGIGSGKSEAAKILVESYGALLLNTDRIAHDFMEVGGVSYQLIKDYFGEEILNEKGQIDREKLGKEVYQNAEKLKILNSFSHPYVMDYVRKLIKIEKERAEKLYSVICVETALPREAGLKDFCDYIWYVTADISIRQERLIHSRNFTSEKFEKISANQFTEDEYKNNSTHVLINNGSIDELKLQIEKLIIEEQLV
jgi:dephospho-CoA kinase